MKVSYSMLIYWFIENINLSGPENDPSPLLEKPLAPPKKLNVLLADDEEF